MTSLTIAQYRKLPKRSKYGNKITSVDGHKFHSRAEYRRWIDLCDQERTGRISNLERQRTFILAPSVKFDGAKKAQPPLRYTCDFYYGENGLRVIEDFKSAATVKETAFVIRRHLMLALYGLQIRIMK